MNLSVLERIVLLSSLPTEGNLVDFRVLRDLKGDLGFSEAEIKKIKLKEDGGQVSWNGEADKEIELGQRAEELIKEALKKLDEEGKVNDQNFGLFARFGLE